MHHLNELVVLQCIELTASRANWRDPRGFDKDYNERGRFDERPTFERSFSSGSRNRYKSGGSYEEEGKLIQMPHLILLLIRYV